MHFIVELILVREDDDGCGRHVAFYSGLRLSDADPLAEVTDYRRCWNAQRRRSARMTWNLFTSEFLKRNIDPYAYLEHYLTPSELEAARLPPQRSREQVDFIIEAADEFSACDDNLRVAIYRVFAVPAGTTT